jgi:hypothetical protein
MRLYRSKQERQTPPQPRALIGQRVQTMSGRSAARALPRGNTWSLDRVGVWIRQLRHTPQSAARSLPVASTDSLIALYILSPPAVFTTFVCALCIDSIDGVIQIDRYWRFGGVGPRSRKTRTLRANISAKKRPANMGLVGTYSPGQGDVSSRKRRQDW